MDRIVVSSREVAEIGDLAASPAPLQPKLPPAIHWGLKGRPLYLVLCLPLLCLFAIIMRLALRNQAPRIRYAWTAYLATLLIISGFLTSATAIAFFSLGGPIQSIAGSYQVRLISMNDNSSRNCQIRQSWTALQFHRN